MNRLRDALTFANVCSFLALAIAISTGSAYAANTVFSSDIVDGEVKTQDLAANAVTSPKILDGGVKVTDINADAVTSNKINDGAVQTADLADNSVGSAQIQTDAVQAGEIADGSIDGGEVVDNSLTQNDLASSSVGNAEIASGAITNAKLGSSSVDSSKVAGNSLTAFDLAGGESNGAISLGAGFAANGRCRDVGVAVGGAHVGDAVIFSINGSVPQGIMLYGVGVPTNGTVTLKVCNLSGGAMAAISNLPVAVVTISI
jgi:hypothetical protein